MTITKLNHADHERHLFLMAKTNEEVTKIVSDAMELEIAEKRILRIRESWNEGFKISWETLLKTKLVNR